MDLVEMDFQGADLVERVASALMAEEEAVPAECLLVPYHSLKCSLPEEEAGRTPFPAEVVLETLEDLLGCRTELVELEMEVVEEMEMTSPGLQEWVLVALHPDHQEQPLEKEAEAVHAPVEREGAEAVAGDARAEEAGVAMCKPASLEAKVEEEEDRPARPAAGLSRLRRTGRKVAMDLCKYASFHPEYLCENRTLTLGRTRTLALALNAV